MTFERIPTLYDWRNKFAKTVNMKKATKPQSKSGIEKLKAITEHNVLPLENIL